MSNPSLILPQSPAYGEDYVYAAQVEDGAVPLYNVLPLTFTRASGGTRINKDGLVQNMPYNLNSYSDDFSTGWGGANRDYTADATTAPNGTTTADKLGATGGTAYYSKVITSSTGQNAFSVYLKYGNRTTQQIYAYASGSYFAQAVFNLQTGVVSSVVAGSATIEDIGNGWFRCTISGSSSGTSIEIGIENISVNTYTYAWGAQLNIGSTAQPYLATTDRLNMPRITYPVGGGCGALLLEKQSTNLATYSEQFDNAAWTKLNSTITANSVTSPDGTQDADTITDNTTNGVHVVYQIPSGQSVGTAWTCYMKKGSLNYGYISAVQSTTFFTTAIINLNDGSIVELQNGSSTTGTVTTENCGNGWYRVKMQTNANGAGYAVGTSNGSALSGTYKEAIYTGTGSGTIYIWGAQLEDSSYATSYIPTTSTSATRIQDVCYKTGISNLIGQTEGTLFADFYWNGNAIENWLVSVHTSSTNFIAIFLLDDGRPYYYILNSGSPQMAYVGTALSIGRHKMAIGYKQNDSVAYMDGNLLNTDTSCTIPTTTDVGIGYFIDGVTRSALINKAEIYKTRLTNAELQALTS